MINNKSTFSLRRLATLGFILLAGIVAIVGSVTTTGGSPPLRPQILMFNYEVQQNSNPLLLVDAIASGQRRLDDEMSTHPCVFLADFSAGGSRVPTIELNGQPDQNGANVTIFVNNPVNSQAGDPAKCGNVENIAISIGSPAEALNLGVPTNLGSARLLINGQQFTNTRGYFKARLDGYDYTDGYKSGTFEFVGLASGNNVILVTGSYAAN